MNILTMTRRRFLATSTAATAVAASWTAAPEKALAAGAAPERGEEVKKIRSTCRGCGKMECGVWVTVKNGRAIKIEGDTSAPQSMGNCCTKSMASLQACYHPERMKYPMKRTRPKGEDPGWVRISWDEAFSTAAANYKKIIAKYGGESLACMGGTSRCYCMGPYVAFKQLFDSPNAVLAYAVCKGPRHFAGQLTDEYAFAFMATVERPSVYVQWGASPEISNYDDAGRVVVDVAKSAKHYINVNPRMSHLGKEADMWLPLRPGTDGALALSWMDVIIRNKMYDELYCKRWTNGPFLVCNDIQASGWNHPLIGPSANGETFELKTRLLKESDIKEGGDPKKFIVYDQLHKRFTYFDAGTSLWENEPAFKVPTKGITVHGGFLPEPTKFNPEIDPALFGEFEVTLKDGRKSKVKPVFEHLAALAAKYTPVKAEKITNVPAAQIERAAKTYATRVNPKYGNGGIHYELAAEHGGNAIQNCRALTILVGLTGNFDGPASNRGQTRGYVNPNPGSASFAFPPPKFDKVLGGEKFPLLKWWGWWADPTTVWDAALTGKPYPVKGGVVQAGDFLNMSNCANTWEALKKLDFWLGIDLWHHPSVEVADIVMPARHWLEMDCPRLSQGSSGSQGATVKCVPGLADTKIDGEIVEGLFKAMGKPWAPLPPAVMEQLMKNPPKPGDPPPDLSKIPGYNPWPGYESEMNSSVHIMEMTWKEYVAKFQKDGWWDVKKLNPDDWGVYRRYEMGVMAGPTSSHQFSKVKHRIPGFQTPTRKQELWSTVIESYHPGAEDELPRWVEPPETPISRPDLKSQYPLIATTGRRIPVYFHSEHRQLPWCREQWPVPLAEINPATAAKYGIKHGDWIWVESPHGKIRQKADLFHGIAPDVVGLEHQWWFPEMPAPEHGWRYSAVNQLVNKENRDRLSCATNLRAYAVKIYKAEAAPDGIILSADDKRLKKWKPEIKTEREKWALEPWREKA